MKSKFTIVYYKLKTRSSDVDLKPYIITWKKGIKAIFANYNYCETYNFVVRISLGPQVTGEVVSVLLVIVSLKNNEFASN